MSERKREAAAGKRGAAAGRAAGAKRRRPAGSGRAAARRERDAVRLNEGIERSTRVRLFLESSVLDFALVLTVSAALTFTVSYGFESAAGYRGNAALVVALTAPLLLALFAGTWSKKALAPSIAATAIVAVGIVAAAVAVSPDPLFAGGSVNDVDGSYGVFALVAVTVPVLVFLLSRRPTGLVFLLLVDVIACGTVQFLYRDWMTAQPGLAAALVALFGIAMLFVYQCYKQSVYSAKRVKRTAFLGAFAFAGLAGAVSVLAAVAVFYGVVSAAGLETPEIKPFEHYVARPIDEKAGAYGYQDVYDDGTTDETNDEERETSEDADGGSQSGSPLGNSLMETPIGAAIMQTMGYDIQDPDQDYEAISYLIVEVVGAILAVLLALLVLAAILLQRRRRVWRLKRIAKRTPEYRVWYLYTFLMGRFGRLKIRKPEHLTPLEFALSFQQPMAPFTRDTGGVDFVEITGLYVDVCYGGCKVDPADCERVEAYYRAFFKNARQHVGWPKWLLWKFWRI